MRAPSISSAEGVPPLHLPSISVTVVKRMRMVQFYARVVVELCAAPVIGERERAN